MKLENTLTATQKRKITLAKNKKKKLWIKIAFIAGDIIIAGLFFWVLEVKLTVPTRSIFLEHGFQFWQSLLLACLLCFSFAGIAMGPIFFVMLYTVNPKIMP